MSSYDLATIETAMLDNVDFRETGSLAKAKAFTAAASRWLILNPESSSDQGTSLSMGRDVVVRLRDDAINFTAANDTSSAGAVAHLGVGTQFRR